MITLTAKKKGAVDTCLAVCLAWEQRLKSRLRVRLDSGLEAGIFLPRGTVLRGGDVLVSVEGEAVLVRAALETVSTVRTSDHLLLARLCYHLGNRHVALEIGREYVRYLHDHVLDGMVHGLGGEARVEEAPFEPEHGAYGEHGGNGGYSGHSHGHRHEVS